jgi:hypothetical protein
MSSRWRAILRSVIDAAHTSASATKVLTSSDSRLGTTLGVAEDGSAQQFLLAEYELVRELPRRKLNTGLAGERLPRSGTVRISSYFRSL